MLLVWLAVIAAVLYGGYRIIIQYILNLRSGLQWVEGISPRVETAGLTPCRSSLATDSYNGNVAPNYGRRGCPLRNRCGLLR